ncbi:MAG: family 43 glycosylhydrolase [Bacteroidales bacterium]|nr:family 43 glycosylhydrolase [Bacteroidales bacterium]
MKSMLIHKQIHKMLIQFSLVLGTLVSVILFIIPTSCTDIAGDGADSLFWEGVELPDQTSFHNPVWEPDLSNPSVFRGATQFFAFGDEKQWSEGLKYNVPVIRSSNLMNWSFTGQAFSSHPAWSEEPVSGVSGVFAKTLSTYYLAYALGDKGIGFAWSKTPQGPYTDYGCIINPDSLGFAFCKDPFFIMSGIKFYVFFRTPDGIYGSEMNIVKNMIPSLRGSLFKIAGTGWSGIYIYRKAADSYYFIGTTGEGENVVVRIARASAITGPYLDRNGTNILDGGGTDLIVGNASNGFVNPSAVGGVFTDFEGKEWIIYQVTDMEKPLLSTGEERHPMMLNRVEWDANGWPVQVIEARGGWHTPKFRLTN